MFNAQAMKEQADKTKISQLFKEVNDEDKVTEVISLMMADIEDNANDNIDYADFELTEDVLNDYKPYVDEVLNIFKSRGYIAFVKNTTMTISYGTLSTQDDSSHISDLHKSIVPQIKAIHNLMPQTFHNQALEIIEELKPSISEVAKNGGYEFTTNKFGFNVIIDETSPIQLKVKNELKKLGFSVYSRFINSEEGHVLVVQW